MQLLAALRKPVHIMLAAMILVVASPSFAETVQEKPSAGAMFVDAVLVRPLYFLLSQGGALVYGATLPFTLLGGNADEAVEALVVTPLQAAFVRCLGCGKVDNAVSSLNEGEGKRIRHFVMATAGLTSYDQSGRTGDAASGGMYLGTHFSLSDTSRFDVMLGYRLLGDSLTADDSVVKYDADVDSIQIASRFGKRIFWNMDLMGKLGMHTWEVDAETTSGTKQSFSGNSFFWGVGLEKFVSNNIRLGLEYSKYSLNDGDFKADVSTADLNFSVMF